MLIIVLIVFALLTEGISAYRISETANTSLIEDDIVVSELMKNKEAQAKAANKLHKRNARRDLNFLWTSRIIPYEYNASELAEDMPEAIENAINGFHDNTCLKFVPKKQEHKKWITFIDQKRCSSEFGRQYKSEGQQNVSLGRNCEYAVPHEIMHFLGFHHEHQRYDRDKYVTIYWENLEEVPIKIKDNFHIIPQTEATTLGFDYDYYSVMHYEARAFLHKLAGRGKFAMTAFGDKHNRMLIGGTLDMTRRDYDKVNALYSCALGCRDAKPVDIKHLTASGSLSLYPPQHGDMMKASGGWCADVNTSSTSFLQLDFGKNTFICSLITTGSSSREAWVTKYTLKYSLDGIYWMSVKDMNGVDKVFDGNTDQCSAQNNTLPTPIKARYFQFVPQKVHGHSCVRVVFYAGETLVKSKWSPWTPCERNICQKSRQRFCSSTDKAKDCPGANTYGVESQRKNCTNQECFAPIDGHWGQWSKPECSASCGIGTLVRTRVCDNPAPRFGGQNCTGNNKKTERCRSKFCNMGPDGCSFTKDFCSWENNPFANIKWVRHSGKTPTPSTGPSCDHTALSGDCTGMYAYLESTGAVNGDKAILRSVVQPGSNLMRCLKFFMYNYEENRSLGHMTAVLTIISTGDIRQLNKYVSKSSIKQWQEETFEFKEQQDYRVEIIAETWLTPDEPTAIDFGIDDISLLWGSCHQASSINPAPQLKPLSFKSDEKICDLEFGFCDWTNERDGTQLNWTRHKDDTPIDYTGPSGDHTTRTGYYAFIDTRSPRKFGDRARLVSKMLSKHFECLSFWYHMNGKHVWQLNVYQNTSKEMLVWSEKFHRGEKWFQASITFKSRTDFNIIIEGIVGVSEQSNIAIDDIMLGKTNCDFNTPQATFATRPSCVFPLMYNYNCPWVALSGDFHWLSSKFSNDRALNKTLPQEGKYVYINSSFPRQRGDKARFASPFISFDYGYFGSRRCIEIKFYKNGNGIIRVLKEYFHKPTSRKIRGLFVTKQGSGSTWIKQEMEVVKPNENRKRLFRIIVQATVGRPGESDVAIAYIDSKQCTKDN